MPGYKKKYDSEEIARLFGVYYGNRADRLEGWQALCDTCDLKAEPSITRCKQALRGINVNIVDLINARKSWAPVRQFESKRQLARDLRDNPSRRFPLYLAKQNGFLAALLVELR